MTDVAILWHMHQPFYEDLVTHEHILPWVRLHALKDYFGMVALLNEFPSVRVTFNLVPSLLVQLEAFAENRARDPFLELSLKPADELTEADIGFILENFFYAHRQWMIESHPRYAQLLAQRGDTASASPDPRAAAHRFSTDDLRDLQVWHKLAWVDPIYLASDARIRGLLAKGRGFSEDDKAVLREVELEILNRVIPEYRAAAARGQIELSTSPFYHPILPLLCDTNVYLRTHPESRMPRERFVHPEDAAMQLSRAVALHERLFGRRPVGLWPSEGSVSDAMVPLATAAGFAWMATDELILSRTVGTTLGRDGNGHLEQPERLYAAFRVGAGADRIACVFRDHVLSDLIGFSYARWPAEAAASDFVSRLLEAGRRYSARTGGGEAIVSVILDGENAWEHFEGGGRPFLRALYRLLSQHPDLRTVTAAEACRSPQHELPSVFPGSWIDANFYIWIGHPDDQRAWSQLAEARRALEAASGIGAVGADALAGAREEVMIAEGSDWFWWYGDDHSSPNDLEFDELFRRHLRNVYTLLQQPSPDELFVTNISAGSAVLAEATPTNFLTPTLDGEETSYFEWLGAGAIAARHASGAMHPAHGHAGFLTILYVGFDREQLYVRIDSARPMQDLLAEGCAFALTFLKPEGVRFQVGGADTSTRGRFWDRPAGGSGWIERGLGGARVAVRGVMEVALPLADLGVAAGAPVSFFVTVHDAQGMELERQPERATVDLTVPDAAFEARNWTV